MVSINHDKARAEGNFHDFNVFKGILLRNCEFIARENERIRHKTGGGEGGQGIFRSLVSSVLNTHALTFYFIPP